MFFFEVLVVALEVVFKVYPVELVCLDSVHARLVLVDVVLFEIIVNVTLVNVVLLRLLFPFDVAT